MNSGEMRLAEAAARSSWWALDLSALRTIASHLNIDVPREADLLEVLVAMTEQTLGIGEERALQLVGHRAVHADSADTCLGDLLEVGEAASVLVPDDEEVLRHEQEATRRSGAAKREFVELYKKHVQQRQARHSAASASGAGSRSRGAAPRPKPLPKALRPREMPGSACTLPQAQMKLLMPPDSFLWKSTWSGSWCARVPPMKQVSRSWNRYGEEGAAKRVISLAWLHWCQLQGKPISDCPVKGLLFDDAD